MLGLKSPQKRADCFVFCVTLLIYLSHAQVSESIAEEASAIATGNAADAKSQGISLEKKGYVSIADRENWTPGKFFGETDSMEAAKAIASGDNEKLQDIIKTHRESTAQGKHGLTLLHWAYLTDNLEAFKLLLDSGFDPDLRITESISTKHQNHASMTGIMQQGDSVLFVIARSALSRDQDRFFDAALAKTKAINAKDASGDTLLLVCANMLESHFCDEESIAKLAKAGADLNAMNKDGDTAAALAFSTSRYLVGVRVWEEGGDPNAHRDTKRSALDFLRARVLREENRISSYSQAERRRILKWLD